MELKIFMFLVGFGITVLSLSYIIIYLNLISIGYNFLEYVKFISRRVECINLFLGIGLMILSFIIKGGKNELYL